MSEKIIYGVSWPRISENSRSVISEDYVPMRDGVEMYTIISVPKGVEKCPIVLYRTPYDHPHNGKPKDLRPFYLNNQFIERGYAVIHQHCRGTGDSLGDCYPYQNEREDGLAMLDYIRTLPFYNGEIFVAGGSYLSSVHLLYLDPVPHDVKGAALDIQTDRMYFRNYRCGMNYSWSNYEWWLSMMKHRFPNPDLTQAKIRPYKDMMKRMIGEDIPIFTGTLIHDKYDEFWQDDPRTNVSEHLTIPVLLTDGWYDFYIDGMFSMWERLSDETRAKSAFVVGPWGHSTRLPKNPEYIPENGSIPSDYAAEWFDSIRENRPYKYAEVGKINYHSIGGGKWCVGDLPFGTNVYRYCLGDGGKLTDKPESGSLTYTYDPEVRLNCFKFHTIYKAHEVGSVDNVLSFVSDEADCEQAFCGRVRFNLEVSSDCEDTAFFARIYFTDGGVTYNLTETITALSYFYPDYKPGEKVTLNLTTPPIAFTLKNGERIRIDIASDGGVYVPHANVRGHWAEVTESKVAHNTVHLDNSFVELTFDNN